MKLNQINSTDVSITVNWNPPAEGGGAVTVMDYIVFYDSVDDSSNEIDVNDTNYAITKLISNSEYFIQVAARGSDGREGIKTAGLSLFTRESVFCGLLQEMQSTLQSRYYKL